jgi:hypothetical protein
MEDYRIQWMQEPNIRFSFGENILIQFRMKKTMMNRIKVKILTWFFPFKLEHWNDLT